MKLFKVKVKLKFKLSCFMNQGRQCDKEMQYFETNCWSANLNWKSINMSFNS